MWLEFLLKGEFRNESKGARYEHCTVGVRGFPPLYVAR
jgi:hypothetical protein